MSSFRSFFVSFFRSFFTGAIEAKERIFDEAGKLAVGVIGARWALKIPKIKKRKKQKEKVTKKNKRKNKKIKNRLKF